MVYLIKVTQKIYIKLIIKIIFFILIIALVKITLKKLFDNYGKDSNKFTIRSKTLKLKNLINLILKRRFVL